VKVALFGSSGLLGSAISKELDKRSFEVIKYHRSQESGERHADLKRINLIDHEHLIRELFDIWPDAIVNCAAISSPDQVDQDPELANKINVKAAQKLAEIAGHLGSRYIHISSDMVFSGRKRPYRSTDQPNPLSEYGCQKLDAEKRILSSLDDNFVVLRVTLLNGNSPKGNRSPHERILRSLKDNQPIRLYDNEFRQPCSSENVASVIVELIERPNLNGLFHWAGSEIITRYDLGLKIMERFGLNSDKIIRTSLNDQNNAKVRRPDHLAFELNPLVGKLKTQPTNIAMQLDGLKIPNDLYQWYRENAEDPSKYIFRL